MNLFINNMSEQPYDVEEWKYFLRITSYITIDT